MIIFPTWAFFGLGSALLSAMMFLLQDRLKVNGYAMAFWNKAACVVLMLPFSVFHGFPTDPLFYGFLALGAIMYAISDVIFFTVIGRQGASAVSRILPASVILSFLLWFAIKPSLLDKYIDAPVNSVLIFATICLSAFFAIRLKKCSVTMKAARAVWFVLFAATVGPILAKTVTSHAPIEQGPYAYVVAEAVMMLAIWSIYFAIRKPVSASVFFARQSWQGGLIVGCVAATTLLLNVNAYYYTDHPTYVPAIKFLDSVVILGVYKWGGRKAQGDIWSGLGIVACAGALIILKSQYR